MLYAIDVTCSMLCVICYTLYVIRYMINMLYDRCYLFYVFDPKVTSKGGQKWSFLTPQIGPMHIGASRAFNLPRIYIFPMDFNYFCKFIWGHFAHFEINLGI